MAPTRQLLAAACLLSACTAATRNEAGPSIRSDVLTAEQLHAQAADAPSAYAAIKRLRPLFLNPRPGFISSDGTGPHIVVFVNGLLAGGVDVLHTIVVPEIKSIRYLGMAEAYTLLGQHGAADATFMVELRR
jgi:hypothetical protein